MRAHTHTYEATATSWDWGASRVTREGKGVQGFLSVDPLTSSYPMLTPYQFASNTPIQAIDLDGLEAFSVHGTQSSSVTFDMMSDDDIQALTGNSTINRAFNWPEGTNGFSNNQDDRATAAQALANHVMDNLGSGQHIALVAHSHGGNVAIQVAGLIRSALDEVGDDRTINLVTLATPAYNGPDDVENPANSPLSSHVHYYSANDAVQTTGANAFGSKTAERTYDAPGTINVMVEDASTNTSTDIHNPGIMRSQSSPDYNPIQSHFIHTRPSLLGVPEPIEVRPILPVAPSPGEMRIDNTRVSRTLQANP